MKVIRFRGKKKEIVERLLRGESVEAIAETVKTSEAYVHNVESELKKLGYYRPHSPNITDSHQIKHQPNVMGTGEAGKPEPLEEEENLDPALRPLQEEVGHLRQRRTGKAQELKFLQEKSDTEAEIALFDRKIAERRAEDGVRRMLVDEHSYRETMRHTLDEDAQLKQEFICLCAELGYRPEEKSDSMLREQFPITHWVYENFPGITSRAVGEPLEYPISTNLPREEWENLMHDLRYSVRLRRYRSLVAVPCRNHVCPYDFTDLTRTPGPVWACRYGHFTTYPCPVCGSLRSYDSGRLCCPECVHRLDDN